MQRKSIFLVSILQLLFSFGYQQNNNDLKAHLFLNYDVNVRPILTNFEKIILHFNATLNAVIDLDEKNQRLLTSLVIKLKWKDSRLKWIIKDIYTPKEIILPSSEVWVPDIYISNNADEGHKGFLHNNKSQVLVTFQGYIYWSLPVIVKSSCQVNVAYFPFDHQFCNIDFTSWTYDSSQIYLAASNYLLDIKNTIENTELFFVNYKILESSIYRPSIKKRYPQITIKFHLSRKITFYIYTVIIPSILLFFLTTFMFILPSSHGGKIEIGLTVFLFLYFLQLIIAQNTPESNSMPLMGAFLFMIMTINSISIMMSTIIVRIMNLAKCDYLSIYDINVPDILWFFINSFFSKLTATSFDSFNKSDIGHLNNLADPLYEFSGTLNSQKWKYIAFIIDRLLFEVFIIGIIITLAFLFIYIPNNSFYVNEF